MTDKLRELLEDVQIVYEGKGMVVHPNSFDKLIMEIIKLDNKNKLQDEQIRMMCCNNCKYRYFMDWKSVCAFDKSEIKDIENPVTCKCKKWELED